MGVYSGTVFLNILVLLFLFLIFIAQRVLFALAAYHDAQAHGNSNAVLWGLAIGFFGVMIPGTIYLCARDSRRSMTQCPNCGYLHDATDFCCPKCGQKNTGQVQTNPYESILAARAKKELYAGIALIAAGLLLMILFMMLCIMWIS